jgi:hypothetical protein
MKNVKIEVTQQELLLLTSLVSDQLFRREFIDPKMPGYRADPKELAMAKDLVLRLKSVMKGAPDGMSQPLGGRPNHPVGVSIVRKA